MPASAIPESANDNSLLSALPVEIYEHLLQHLEQVSLPAGKILYDSNEPIKHVYFPINSIIFLLTLMEDGATTEVGVVGFEGMLGTSICTGVDTVPNQAMVLVANKAMRMRAEVLKEEFDRGGPLQTLLLRYMQALFIQVSQTGACNRIHQMEVRLCRWLLLMHDRAQSDDLPLTQQLISQMLGTPRPYVTVAAGILQKEGLIRCGRGHITILDRQGLEANACECYGIIKEEFNRLLGSSAQHLARREYSRPNQALNSQQPARASIYNFH